MLANGTGIDAVLDKALVTTGNQSAIVTDTGGVLQTYDQNLEFEDPVSQRKVAAALFKDDSILLCGADSVSEYNARVCNAKYNYNLLGMPGCFVNDESNYIGNYQNISGVDWKTPSFMVNSCPDANNIYASFKWRMYNGTVMDKTHNGIDFRNVNDRHEFYAISSGVLIAGDKPNGKVNTIAVYDATNNLTVLYLHSDPAPRKGGRDGVPIGLGDPVNVGDYLGNQGNNGAPYHVHVSVRVGKNFCACSDDPKSTGDYLPPVATAQKFLSQSAAPQPPSPPPSATPAPGSFPLLSAGPICDATSGQNAIQLTWLASTNALSYRVVRDGTPIGVSLNASQLAYLDKQSLVSGQRLAYDEPP